MAKKVDPEFQKLAAAAQQMQEVAGLAPTPEFNQLAQQILQLGVDNNVLITFEIREMPSRGAVKAAKPISCSCLCACACSGKLSK